MVICVLSLKIYYYLLILFEQFTFETIWNFGYDTFSALIFLIHFLNLNYFLLHKEKICIYI